MSLSLSLKPRVLRSYDADAAAYISAVEAADNQSLESGVKDAITEFVVGCKIRGVWDAIKSCCLLCGARTLNGALVPLKGPAPTNFNSLFTNSDYNRETGLKGNGTNKWINTNFESTSPLVDQDNLHFSFYISSLNSNTGGSRSYMADGGRNMYRSINNLTLTQFNINSSFGSSLGDLAMAVSRGFCGLSRNNLSFQSIRISGSNRRYSANSIANSGTLGGTFRIFGRNGNGVMSEFSDGRIAFYSIGESLDLRLLQQCIDKYIYNISFSTSNNTILALASNGEIISPTDYTLNGINYRAYTFSGPTGELRVLRSSSNLDYLLVAGGGGGGGWYSGGGGAGGVLQGSVVLPIGSYPVVIGTGGLGVGGGGRGQNGGHSSFYNLLAVGGGGGARYTEAGSDGGSGGGASMSSLPGAGKVGQGNRGGSFSSAGGIGGAGGGGAGGPGPDPTTNPGICSFPGGSGIFSNISGTSTLYASGGAGTCGGANATVIGGGGDGHFSNASNAPGGRGGNGILIIRHIL